MNLSAPEWPPAAPGVANFLEIAEARDARWFLKKFWLWIAASTLLAALIGVVWAYYFPPLYVSKATVRFLPPQVTNRFVNPNFSMEVGQRTYALSQLLGSRLTASKMIQAFSLYPERRRFQTVEDLTAKFSSSLKVIQIGDDVKTVPTLQLSFAYPDAEKAQQVVQKLIEQVYEENRKYRGDQSLGTTEFLQEQLNDAEDKVLEAEQRLGEIQDSIGLTVSQTKLGMNTSRSYVVDTRLRDLRHDRRQLEERKGNKLAEREQLELLHRRIETRPAEFYIPEFEGMPHYWHLREKLSSANSRLERLKERYNANMPDVISAENDVKEAESGVDRFHRERGSRLKNRDLEANAAKIAMAKLELLGMDKEAAEQIREEAELRAEAQRIRDQQGSPAGQEVDLLVAKREYEAVKEHHNQLLKKHEESRAASEMERRGQGESVELLEPASRPNEPERPDWAMRVATAASLGLVLSSFCCLMSVLRNPRVLHGGHLEKWAGLPVLASFAVEGKSQKASVRRTAAAASLVAILILSGCGAIGDTAQTLFAKGEAAEHGGRASLAMLHYRQAVRKDARFGPAYEAIARIALRLGELEAAREALARAVELNPDKHLLQKQLADTSYQIYYGDPGRPMALLREIEALGERLRSNWPNLPDGYRILSQVLIERHRSEEAIALLEKASGRVERNESLRAQMAAAMYRVGQSEEAEEVLKKLIADSPLYADAYDLLYLQQMQRHESAEAREVLQLKFKNFGELEAGMQLAAHDDAHGDRAGAVKILDGVRELARKRPMGLAKIGDFWLERKQWESARTAYRDGMEYEAGKRPDYVGRLAEWHLAQGQNAEARKLVEEEFAKNQESWILEAYLAAVRLGEVPDARRVEERKRLEAILLRMPDSPFVRYHLGRAYLLDRKLAPAADQFERAVRLDANYAPGWLALAELELHRGNSMIAELRAESALKIQPGNVRAMMVSAQAQTRRGKLSEAHKALSDVMASEPQNDDALYLLAITEAGQGKTDAAIHLLEQGRKRSQDLRWPLALMALHSRKGEMATARKTIEEAMAAAGKKTQLLESMAAIQVELKDGRGALNTYEELLKQDAGNFEYRLGQAGALGLSGNREAALRQFTELQKLRKDDVRVWLQPAVLLGEMGRTADARQAYAEALRLNPNHPIVLNNLAWLLLERREDEKQALELAQRAKRAVRQSPEVDGTLAAAYDKLNMHHNAVAVYEEMLTYVPASDKPRIEKLLMSSRKKQRKDGTS